MFNFLTKMFYGKQPQAVKGEQIEQENTEEDTEEEITGIMCSISYFMTKDGIINTDLGIIDYTPESIKRFAALMSAISSFQVRLDTLEIVKEAFDQTGNKKLFASFANNLIEEDAKVIVEIEKTKRPQKSITDPYITPSELFEQNNQKGG